VEEHNLFADSVEYGVDCSDICDFNEDNTGDSQSTAEDCIDGKNLFNPLLIQNEMENQLTEWDDIQNEIFDRYNDYIMCDLDPNSPPMEEDTPSDNDQDVADADDADMIAITAYEDADCYYSYDDFSFLDTREEHDRDLRKNSVRKSHCENQMYFYQKYFQKAKSHCDNAGGYHGLAGRANIGNCENMNILVGKREARVIFKYYHIIMKLPGEYKQDFVTYDNERFELLGLGSINQDDVMTKFPCEIKDVKKFFTNGVHSIMKNFPVPKVFNINNHACVSLEETIRIMAGYHGLFGFAWDG
jgi:hypothetical protein